MIGRGVGSSLIPDDGREWPGGQDDTPLGLTWRHHEAVHLATCTLAAKINPELGALLAEVRDRIAATLPPRELSRSNPDEE